MTSTRLLMLAALIGPALVLGAALASQYVGGLAPCQMCIWQRWPHAIAIALAALAIVLGPGRIGAGLLWLGAAALLVGAAIGVFHSGVEWGFWEGPSTCTAGGDISQMTTEELIAQIQGAPLIRCDEIPWSFLGLSLAGWNAVASLILAVLTVRAAMAAWAAGTVGAPGKAATSGGPAAGGRT